MKAISAIAVGILIAALVAVRSHRDTLDASPVGPDSLTSPAGPGAAEPNLAVSPDGRAYLSWLEPDAAGYALKLSAFDGRRWSEARTIRAGRDFFVNWADFPSVSALGDGRLAAHWLQRTGSATYAYGVRIAFSKDEGRSWSDPMVPHRDTSPQEHGFVSMWREGNLLGATWLDGRKYKPGRHPTNEMTVQSTMIGPDGRPGAEFELDGRACDCCQTSAALTSRGPVVVYRDRSPEEIRDMYIVRRVNGRWTSPVPVHDDGWKVSYCPVNGPNVDARGERLAVAWFTAANESPRVNIAFSTNAGETFGAPIRIDEGNPSGRVDVELLESGDALVSWVERTGGDTAAIRVRRVSRNGMPSAPVTLAASTAARASGFPRMAIVKDDVMFAWTVPGRPSRVRVARMPIASIR